MSSQPDNNSQTPLTAPERRLHYADLLDENPSYSRGTYTLSPLLSGKQISFYPLNSDNVPPLMEFVSLYASLTPPALVVAEMEAYCTTLINQYSSTYDVFVRDWPPAFRDASHDLHQHVRFPKGDEANSATVWNEDGSVLTVPTVTNDAPDFRLLDFAVEELVYPWSNIYDGRGRGGGFRGGWWARP